jgi:hypothetical protein
MASLQTSDAMESLVYERDRQEFALGDTLDIKTGLILASLTFLAIQSGDLIKAGMSLAQAVAQSISVLAMVVGGVLCVAELWPRDYGREPAPEKYQKWISDLEAYSQAYPDTDPITAETLIAARVSAAIENAKTNLAINQRKSTLMLWAFGCVAVAFATNISTLVIRLF